MGEDLPVRAEVRRPLQAGDPAPDFILPAINREGIVSLEDYRGKSPVLIGLFRGLHCPFCRRQVVQLAASQDKLRRLGVETLGIINTTAERARLYFRFRPCPLVLLADPEASTHRAYGVPHVELTSGEAASSGSEWPRKAAPEELMAVRLNPTGELPEPASPIEAMRLLNERDGFQFTEVDKEIMAAHGTLLTGHFLIDAGGLVRWTRVEAEQRMADLAKFPSEDELLAAARALPG
jgi:peroxiredoxin